MKVIFYLGLCVILLCVSACAQSGDEQDLEFVLDGSRENIISLGIVEDLKLSDLKNLTIADCVALISNNSPSLSFKEGDMISANALILIDFDEVYASWEDFAVQTVCEKANYGLFQTIDSFTAPNIGQFWYIIDDN